jgi:hypothetical protein
MSSPSSPKFRLSDEDFSRVVDGIAQRRAADSNLDHPIGKLLREARPRKGIKCLVDGVRVIKDEPLFDYDDWSWLSEVQNEGFDPNGPMGPTYWRHTPMTHYSTILVDGEPGIQPEGYPPVHAGDIILSVAVRNATATPKQLDNKLDETGEMLRAARPTRGVHISTEPGHAEQAHVLGPIKDWSWLADVVDQGYDADHVGGPAYWRLTPSAYYTTVRLDEDTRDGEFKAGEIVLGVATRPLGLRREAHQ